MPDVPDRVWISKSMAENANALKEANPDRFNLEYRRVKSCVWRWDETLSMGFGGYRYGCCDKIAEGTPNYCPECGGDVEIKELNDAR